MHVFQSNRGIRTGLSFLGDLLFVGDIGRPDLPGAEILDEQVENLYNSLCVKFWLMRER